MAATENRAKRKEAGRFQLDPDVLFAVRVEAARQRKLPCEIVNTLLKEKLKVVAGSANAGR